VDDRLSSPFLERFGPNAAQFSPFARLGSVPPPARARKIVFAEPGLVVCLFHSDGPPPVADKRGHAPSSRPRQIEFLCIFYCHLLPFSSRPLYTLNPGPGAFLSCSPSTSPVSTTFFQFSVLQLDFKTPVGVFVSPHSRFTLSFPEPCDVCFSSSSNKRGPFWPDLLSRRKQKVPQNRSSPKRPDWIDLVPFPPPKRLFFSADLS